MEAKVHRRLSALLAQHSLQDAVNNIDDIVLSYLLGVLDLVGSGEVEDCFDLEDVMDMMDAYLPGFQRISRSDVMEWIFSLAAELKKPEQIENGVSESNEKKTKERKTECNQPSRPNKKQQQSSFPCYEFDSQPVPGDVKQCTNGTITESSDCGTQRSIDIAKDASLPFPSLNCPPADFSTAQQPNAVSSSLPVVGKEKSFSHKRKKRQQSLSCSSQESQEDASKTEVSSFIDDSVVQSLLEMFPSACSMEVTHCLHLAGGDINTAAQLVMDRQEIGQSVNPSQKTSRKSKKATDVRLDDNDIKSSLIERYSFYDADDEKKTHRPPPLKNEAKKLVRYRDGQVVSTKGERFSEIKKT